MQKYEKELKNVNGSKINQNEINAKNKKNVNKL